MPERLTLKAAAERAGVTTSALRHAIRLGHLRAEKFGPIWTVTLRDLKAYMLSRPNWQERKPWREDEEPRRRDDS